MIYKTFGTAVACILLHINTVNAEQNDQLFFFNFQIFSNAFSWLKFLTSDTWWPFEMLNHRLAIYILMNELTLGPMIVGLDVVPGKTYMLAFTAFALQWNPLKRPGMSH